MKSRFSTFLKVIPTMLLVLPFTLIFSFSSSASEAAMLDSTLALISNFGYSFHYFDSVRNNRFYSSIASDDLDSFVEFYNNYALENGLEPVTVNGSDILNPNISLDSVTNIGNEMSVLWTQVPDTFVENVKAELAFFGTSAKIYIGTLKTAYGTVQQFFTDTFEPIGNFFTSFNSKASELSDALAVSVPPCSVVNSSDFTLTDYNFNLTYVSQNSQFKFFIGNSDALQSVAIYSPYNDFYLLGYYYDSDNLVHLLFASSENASHSSNEYFRYDKISYDSHSDYRTYDRVSILDKTININGQIFYLYHTRISLGYGDSWSKDYVFNNGHLVLPYVPIDFFTVSDVIADDLINVFPSDFDFTLDDSDVIEGVPSVVVGGSLLDTVPYVNEDGQTVVGYPANVITDTRIGTIPNILDEIFSLEREKVDSITDSDPPIDPDPDPPIISDIPQGDWLNNFTEILADGFKMFEPIFRILPIEYSNSMYIFWGLIPVIFITFVVIAIILDVL